MSAPFTSRSPNWIIVEGEPIPAKPKGVHTVSKTLADLRRVLYDYAWKSGPPLVGFRTTAEYLASHAEALARRNEVPVEANTIRALIAEYKRSTWYTDLAAATKYGRQKHLEEIDREFGDMPYSAIEAKGSRRLFKAWRQEIVDGTKPPLSPNTPAMFRVQPEGKPEQRKGSRAQADRYWEALNRLMNYAVDEEYIEKNPCAKVGRLYWATRREYIWTFEHESRFFQGIPEHKRAPAPYYLQDAYYLGVWTGQREYDLINLRWSAYDGTYITLQQHKRPNPYREGKRVKIRAAEPLKRRLDMMAVRQGVVGLSEEERAKRYVLLNSMGQPWLNGKSFSQSFHRFAKAAGVPDRTYHDLRGTAVVRFARAGSKVLQIMAITGHSLGDVNTVFETHYMALDEEMGDQAVEQRELSTVYPTDLAPTGTIDIAAARNLANAFSGSPTAPQTAPQLAPNRSLSVPEEREMFRLLLNEVKDIKKRLG